MIALQIVAGLVLLGLALWDIFHTMVLPRTFASTFRLTHLFYRASWPTASFLARKMRRTRTRDSLLATFGPLSLIALIACWAAVLIVGFALIESAVEHLGGDTRSFGRSLYLSGTTFFTLGLGDEKPTTSIGRLLTVIEAGTGFGVLAVVIGYLPVLYQSFSRRELEIALLASRAGYPSTAAGLLTRLGKRPSEDRMIVSLLNQERWCAELMENHSSYPMLAFYRSQHDRQSWLASLTMLLDSCAILQVGFDNHPEWRDAVEDQAELTFSMGCRALVKLSTLIGIEPRERYPDRLRVRELEHLRKDLERAGLNLRTQPESLERLMELRQLYEPYSFALANHLLLDVPPFIVGRDYFEPTTPEAAVKDAVDLL